MVGVKEEEEEEEASTRSEVLSQGLVLSVSLPLSLTVSLRQPEDGISTGALHTF
jgi:hypothetical protein